MAPDPPDEVFKSLHIPASEAASLDNHPVIIRGPQEIMKYKPGLRIFPTFHFPETQIIKNKKSVLPLFDRIIPLGESQKVLHVRMRPERRQQGIIPEEGPEIDRPVFVKQR